jgi:molybdopterin synthase catalytic subunit
MASDHFRGILGGKPVSEIEAGLSASDLHGADLRFYGVVRKIEAGREISGITYSGYEPMALKELHSIGEVMHQTHPEHRAFVYHRLGFVAAGEPSLLIRVQTTHSAAAFAITQEYLKQIKQTVPIWKEPVYL